METYGNTKEAHRDKNKIYTILTSLEDNILYDHLYFSIRLERS